jgi:hypothetical protein
MDLITAPDSQPRDENYRALEAGNILYFPRTPFDLPEEDRAALRATAQVAGSHHKNIAYRPAQDKVTGFDSGADAQKLHDALRSYSRRALDFLRGLLPRYMADCRIDYASFRPQEEEGRDLPLNKRNDLLHVDSFPTRPTGGDLILRFFTNINPVKSRVWMVSDPIAELAPKYANDAGLPRIAEGGSGGGLRSLLKTVGLAPDRSPYDRFMLGFHDYLKGNREYQENCPKYRFEFPPDSTWMVFTDVVPHAVLSGQFALEQTVMVRRQSLLAAESAPIAVLERLCGKALA